MALENKSRLDWIDGLKAFAILGILLNHTVELFGPGPWFSNPSYDWPDLQTRLENIFPQGDNIFVNIITFLGWLGDMGPGVFIFVSGFTLTLSAQKRSFSKKEFFHKRFLRIYPLYILIHLIVNVFLIAVNVKGITSIASENNILSLLGLRFKDSLFFYLNPSWWFVWLIIQFYAIYPFLFKNLKKTPKKFLFITLIITISSRIAGIADFTYSNSLYFWMTGLFGGTRLFEFAIGMYLAHIFVNPEKGFQKLLNKPLNIFIFSFFIYLTGFVCAWTYIGSLFSNIFITIGLSGVFYGVYSFLARVSFSKKIFSYIGKNSFVVFLIHQPVLIFIANKYNDIALVILLFTTIVLSFVISPLLEKISNRAFKLFKNILTYPLSFGIKIWHLFFWTGFFFIAVGSVLFPLYDSSKFFKLYKLYYYIFIAFSILYLIKLKQINTGYKYLYMIILILIELCILILLPDKWVIYLLISLFVSILLYLSLITIKNNVNRIVVSLTVLFALTFAGHLFLKENKPVEIGRWGEYPALQIDSVTTYSLIPNKTTHLKYNNYDYFLKTNSYGLASPEKDYSVKDTSTIRIFILGDAFSMPEGMEYEFAYPAILEKLLTEKYPKKKIQVVNGGVTGYGPNEMLAQLNQYLGVINPDIVINQFFINEFSEINITPEERLRNIGLQKVETNKFPFLKHNQLVKHLELSIRDVLNYPDKNHYYWKSLLFMYEKNSRYYTDTVISKMNGYFVNINHLKNLHKFDYYLLYVPGQLEISKPEDIDYYPSMYNPNDTSKYNFEIAQNAIKKICKENDIIIFDTKDFLKNNPIQPLYFSASWHWNKDGHQEIANYICNQLNLQYPNGK